MLGIETSCDETSAAVVSETDGAWSIGSNIVASQVAIHREWGGVVPELASRQHIRDICGVVRAALDTAKVDLSGSRRDRRDAGTRASSARCSSACRLPSRSRSRWIGRSCRCTIWRATSSRCSFSTATLTAAPGRARRVGRPHQPLSSSKSRARTRASAGRAMMRQARRTTRSRSCSGSDIQAGRSSTSAPAKGTTRRSRFRSTRMTHADRNAPTVKGRSRLQLQRAEDGGAAPRAAAHETRARH